VCVNIISKDISSTSILIFVCCNCCGQLQDTRARLAWRTRDPLSMCDQEGEELGEHFGHKQSVRGRDDDDKSVCYWK